MNDEGREQQKQDGFHPGFQFALFDSDGLPWTSRIGWGWLILLSLITGFLVAVLLGIYLGVWLRSKRQSALVLSIYVALTILYVAFLLLPSSRFPTISDVLASMALLLWFAGAFILRHRVIRRYTEREGIQFRINPILALFFSVWYINGCLRADFPLSEAGEAPKGILKLTI
jgi:hypothetical protein